MKGVLFRPDVLKAKLAVLDKYGEAQTRRIDKGLREINAEPNKWDYGTSSGKYIFWYGNNAADSVVIQPRYHVGEIVYVKEAWYPCVDADQKLRGDILFKDEATAHLLLHDEWHSPLFLRAKDARHFLQIPQIRLQRLWDITEEDATAEGITEPSILIGNQFTKVTQIMKHHGETGTLKNSYISLFYRINPEYKDTNPWTWVYHLKKAERPEATK